MHSTQGLFHFFFFGSILHFSGTNGHLTALVYYKPSEEMNNKRKEKGKYEE